MVRPRTPSWGTGNEVSQRQAEEEELHSHHREGKPQVP